MKFSNVVNLAKFRENKQETSLEERRQLLAKTIEAYKASAENAAAEMVESTGLSIEICRDAVSKHLGGVEHELNIKQAEEIAKL